MKRALRPAGIAAVALAAALATPAAGQVAAGRSESHQDDVSSQRQAELRALVLQDCGSCHGMRLTGGLGPALTAGALRDRPAESLVATILQGRPGTAMPPWEGLLTRAEADWIARGLIQGAFVVER